MSNINFQDINVENIGDVLSDPIGAFRKVMSAFYDFFGQENQDEFLAVSLTNRVAIDDSELKALGYGTSKNGLDKKTFYKFKARTVAKDGPHIVLTDPCILTDKMTEDERCLRNALIAAHTTVITDSDDGPIGVGDVIRVKFSRNADDTLNLRMGRLVKLVQNREFSSLTPEACEFIQTVFEEFSDTYEPIPPITINGEIFQLAEEYDLSNDIKYKNINNKKISGLLKPFDMYVKAFILEAHRQIGADVKLTSATRSYQEQKELYNKWEANGKTGIRPANPDDSSGTFSSLHEVGLAVDFNFEIDGVSYLSQNKPFMGKTFTKDESGRQQHKSIWVNSNIVLVIDAIGLKWGGDFAKNYDPIHIEFPYDNPALGFQLTKQQVYQAFRTKQPLDTFADPSTFGKEQKSPVAEQFEEFNTDRQAEKGVSVNDAVSFGNVNKDINQKIATFAKKTTTALVDSSSGD